MKSGNHPMMHIKNYITGGTAIVLSIVCLLAIWQGGYEKRIMYAAIVLLLAGIFSLWTASRAAKLERESKNMKDTSATDKGMDRMLMWQVIDRLLFSVTLVFILLYGILKVKIYLWIGAGMCTATVVLLVVLFVIHKWQTKE